MIFADKLIMLRKKNGWSQEELADRINVSRQSVSKWEGAQSVPDLGKILALSNLFGVTTDYLLKDEIESEEYTQEDATVCRRVTLEEAHRYLDFTRQNAGKFALYCSLCILCPIPLFLLATFSERPNAPFSEGMAIFLGFLGLLLILVPATVGFILHHYKKAPFRDLEDMAFETEYGVEGFVKEQKKEYMYTHRKYNIIGAVLCCFSALPLFACGLYDSDFFAVCMLCLTLVIASVGIYFFISTAKRYNSMELLLELAEETYTPEQEEESSALRTIASVYWTLVTALYFLISFLTNSWGKTWIIWPVAGLLFSAIEVIVHWYLSQKQKP